MPSKFVCFATLLVIPVCCEYFHASSDVSTNAQAVFEVCEKFFIEKSIEFDIIGFGSSRESMTPALTDLIDEIGKRVDGRMQPHLVRFFTAEQGLVKLARPALIITSSKDLNLLHRGINIENFQGRPLKFLTVTYDGRATFNETFLEAKLTLVNGQFHHYEYILSFMANELVLETFEWFSPDACNEIQLTTVNKFNKTARKWHTQLENHEKFRNFHKCGLIALVNGYSFNYYLDKFSSKKLGTLAEVFNGSAQILNFTPHFNLNFFPGEEEIDSCQLFINTIYSIRMQGLTNTLTFFQESVIIAISPNAPFSIYEKLFMPFDGETWSLCLATILISLSVILVVNFLPNWVKDLVYGERVRTPIMNVLYIFFGFGQMVVPRRFFARYLLLNFIFFCLIFRTCYQSKLYEFMTSDMRPPLPQKVSELVEKNYTITAMNVELGLGALKVLIGEREVSKIKTFPVNEAGFPKFNDILKHSYKDFTTKRAFMMTDYELRQFTSHWRASPLLFRDPIVTAQVGFVMMENHFLNNITAHVTGRFIDMGILQYSVHFAEFMLHRQDFMEEVVTDPQVLNLSDLSFGFYIWMVCCGICLISYMLEILRFKMRRPARKLVGLGHFLWLLRGRLQYHRA